MKQEVLNRVPAEFRPLLNLEHLTAWTLDRQREHNADLSAYEAGYAAFEVALRSQYIAGDRKFAARWRARKVNKHWKALIRASRDAAHASESLRLAYADHVREVAALPAQRAEKAAAKAGRRKSVGGLAAKSLHKTAATMAPGPDQEESTAGETSGQAPTVASGGRKIRGVNDLFDRQGA
ncbi:hypothetical protein FEF34_40000 [Streptomyces marianii]|uniref:Uncharacterized protein n=2 Tax=Streptomyces marianii TaxID=1817406 RepID=A0A5R9DSL9_9ACTN|nr:hypothetical protein FEF34_40000 [Streptomyces marianii]